MSERRTLYLIDGSGYIHRAYHALPPMTRPDGTPVNAVYGFTQMILKLIQDVEADHLAVIFDTARKSFRNDIYPDYKANRPPAPEDLAPQFDIIREATRAFGLPCIEKEGYEADDLIATYARRAREAGADVVVVSSDKDLMQLLTDGVSLLDPVKNKPIDREAVRAKFGVDPDRVVDVQALAGDSSDNVPGVPGIGVKTAATLIEEYGDLDSLLDRAAEIKQPKRRQTLVENAELARVSRDLVSLRDDVEVAEDYESFVVGDPDPEVVRGFLQEQGFRSILARFEGEQAARGRSVGDTAAAREQAPAETVYELVTDPAELDRWIAAAHDAGTVAVDTETDSLDAMRARLVGVSLSVAAGRACYIPLGHRGGGSAQGSLDLGDGPEAGDALLPGQIALETAMARLAPLFADPSVLKVGQNIKYDMLVLARHGAPVRPVDDTMLISYDLETGLHGHGLDELAELHLSHTTIKYGDVCGTGRNKVTFDRVAPEDARAYACEDADITGRLHRMLKPRLVAEGLTTVYETLDRPLVPGLVAMERAGIKVDATRLRAMSGDFETRLAALEETIHGLAGRAFNIGSPKQLGEVLFDEMGHSGGKKGKTGAYGTGADILERLAAEGSEIASRVLDWRQIAKLKSTYADALVKDINPETGRLHTAFAQAVTSTGRLSSSDPNLQNIPIRTEEGRKIREAFVAEPGHVLLSADYSQIELRLIAHVAGVAQLIAAFRNGDDIHAITASQVFGVPVEGMDPSIRRQAKAINFGIIYGISGFGLAAQLGIPQKEAQAYIDAYFERFPEIRAYMEETKAVCREHGHVTTLFGRRCHVPGIKDKAPARRNFAERAAINAPIQGGAADIIKRAMIRLPRALDDAGLDARLLLQVHDELVLEVPVDQVEDTRAVVRRVMESAADLSVPLLAETGHGESWAAAH